MPLFTPDSYELLPARLRSREDLPILAERAEAAVLDFYSDAQGVVMLKGYDPDPALMDEDLVRRLLLTIATVIEHLAEAPDPNVESVRRGGRSVTFRRRTALPQGFGSLLARFDEREPLFRI